jgi:hypothetical protein
VHKVLTSIGFTLWNPRDFGMETDNEILTMHEGINQVERYYESGYCKCIFWYEYDIFDISITMLVEYYPADAEDKHDYRQVKFDTFEDMLNYLSTFHTDFHKSIRKMKLSKIIDASYLR